MQRVCTSQWANQTETDQQAEQQKKKRNSIKARAIFHQLMSVCSLPQLGLPLGHLDQSFFSILRVLLLLFLFFNFVFYCCFFAFPSSMFFAALQLVFVPRQLRATFMLPEAMLVLMPFHQYENPQLFHCANNTNRILYFLYRESLPRLDNYRISMRNLKRPSIGELQGEAADQVSLDSVYSKC